MKLPFFFKFQSLSNLLIYFLNLKIEAIFQQFHFNIKVACDRVRH